MNNEKEFDFLNGTQKPVKERKNIFLKILVIIGWFLYIIIYFICGFIEILSALFLTSSIIKTTHKRKHKKRRLKPPFYFDIVNYIISIFYMLIF